jgi:hypothetical protein
MTATNESTDVTELQDEEVDLFAEGAMEALTAPPEETVTEPETVDSTEGDDNDQTIPAKFKGKSVAEVAESYAQLESEFGRRNNEVSEMRKTLDSILTQQLAGNTEPTEEDEDQAAVEKALAASPTLKAVTDSLEVQSRNTARNDFDKVHPNAQKTISSKGFVKWVTDSPVRQNQFVTANGQYDYDSMAEMLGTYEEVSSVRKANKAAKVEGDMKTLVTPDANGGDTGQAPAGKRKVFKLSDLMKLRDTDPDRYEKLGPVINAAYSEGRVLRDK